MYNSILVPLDGSRNAERALPIAINIARAAGVPINLMTVQVPVPILAAGPGVMDPGIGHGAVVPPDDYLRRVAERVAATGVNTITLGVLEPSALVFGTIGDEIAHRADVNHAGLIVMTTHARAAVPRMFLGSVARDVVRTSKVPVLLMRPHSEEAPDLTAKITFRHVLVALDGSSFSEEVLNGAVELGQLAGAHYTLLRVIEPPRAYGTPVEPVLLPIDEIALGELKRDAEAYLEKVADRMRKRELQVATKVMVESSPAEAIVRQAAELAADVIAMTSHARGGFGTLVLGSVTNQVVRSTIIPVLTYRPREG
jgi:nucleotide-binding universal stress UspA family protein